jgi:hypothetical protein
MILWFACRNLRSTSGPREHFTVRKLFSVVRRALTSGFELAHSHYSWSASCSHAVTPTFCTSVANSDRAVGEAEAYRPLSADVLNELRRNVVEAGIPADRAASLAIIRTGRYYGHHGDHTDHGGQGSDR